LRMETTVAKFAEQFEKTTTWRDNFVGWNGLTRSSS
jgi:hypothetical protein